MQEKRTFQHLIVLFVGILAVSSASLLIRFAQQEVPSLVIAAYRMTLAALLAAPFCIRSFMREVPASERRVKGLILLAGLFLALHFAVWITSLEYTSVASSVVLVTTAPLWVALLSPAFLNEHLTKWTVIGMAVSLTGSVIVGMGSGCEISSSGIACSGFADTFRGRNFIGDAMALAGAFLSGGYLMVGRKVRETISLSSYVFSVYGTAAFFLMIFVFISGEKILGYTGTSTLWMMALALIPQLIGHSSFNWALKYLPAVYVSIALLGEPIGTVILTMIFLEESPMLPEIIGGFFILAGIIMATGGSRTGR